jgi:cobalamin biosynthesis protein CobC
VQGNGEARVSDAWERLFQHGGDINSARLAFPNAPEPWLDLSTGINPVPYPVAALDPALWTRLPAPAEVAALERAAAARYGAPAEHVVAAPGAQALIQWLPRLFPAATVAIPGPTYGGHATAWRAAGAKILDRAEPGAPVVVVNPNNPDGRRLSPAELRLLAAQASLLVVDEAFADFDDETLSPDPPPRTVVLRSFGKAYGLAGVRLGFAIARPEIVATIRAALGAWPVSGPAMEIGRRALADGAWITGARARLEADAAWLDARLRQAGFEIVGGTLLFRLARRADAARAFAALAARGVLTRPFTQHPDWLRFGLPRPEDRARLAAALDDL